MAIVVWFFVFISRHTSATCVDGLFLSTPSVYFEADGDRVHDISTGMTWQRCAVGQRWDKNAQHCMLLPKEKFLFNWEEAKQVAESHKENGWRIPNKIELLSIVERACTGPAINETFFPDTPYQYFWSADIPRALPDNVWVVHFKTGELVTLKNDKKISVRLVK